MHESLVRVYLVVYGLPAQVETDSIELAWRKRLQSYIRHLG